MIRSKQNERSFGGHSDEITAQIECALTDADIRSPISIVVPSRHSLVTIACPCDLPSEEWSRMSSIVCEVIGQKLGREGLRGRPLARATANAVMAAGSLTCEQPNEVTTGLSPVLVLHSSGLRLPLDSEHECHVLVRPDSLKPFDEVCRVISG